jgi:hypothetical protein
MVKMAEQHKLERYIDTNTELQSETINFNNQALAVRHHRDVDGARELNLGLRKMNDGKSLTETNESEKIPCILNQ